MSNKVALVENSFNDAYKESFEKRDLIFGSDNQFRALTKEEIEILEHNGNSSDNWDHVLVGEKFDPTLIRTSEFYGKIRIKELRKANLKFHDFEVPVGIMKSRFINCDIGSNCSISYVRYLSHYIIHDNVILHDISEMQTTDHSKFGNGVVVEGEDPSVRVDLRIMNENGGRAILPFDSLICADAILWADHRDDKLIDENLRKITDNSYSKERGWYGEVGSYSAIKGCGIIKDVKFGECCYAKGCNKLKNLTVKSSEESPTQLGEGIELVNGIVGYGCNVFYGCKAIRFVMCENTSLKYGARLINSVLGDNSTISCCEVLSNLVFPFHEQHHNNSFLISSLIMGQSNMAAGANIGSNHNSRSADGELRAGRGFWPALSSTLKFDCNFGSFTIIAKGNYIHELNMPLPFTLISDNVKEHRREIMPAYWWMYNMYALERNSQKFTARDKRKFAVQHIETDYLAPDTVQEIINAIDTLKRWTDESKGLDGVYANDIERSHTPIKVLKCGEAIQAYETMLLYYGIKTCALSKTSISELDKASDQAFTDWTNLGGQLVPTCKVEELRTNIKNSKYRTWDDIHAVYDSWFLAYEKEKSLHAMKVLKDVLGVEKMTAELWEKQLEKLKEIRAYIDSQVRLTREKDYQNNFRLITYRNPEERDAVLGKLDDNEFIKQSSANSKEILSKAQLWK